MSAETFSPVRKKKKKKPPRIRRNRTTDSYKHDHILQVSMYTIQRTIFFFFFHTLILILRYLSVPENLENFPPRYAIPQRTGWKNNEVKKKPKSPYWFYATTWITRLGFISVGYLAYNIITIPRDLIHCPSHSVIIILE